VEIFINGHHVPVANAKINVFNRTLLFGEGLFETILIHAGRPVFLKEHLNRLWASFQVLGWKVGSFEKQIPTLLRCVQEGKIHHGRLRIVCVPRGNPGDLLYSEHRGYDWIFYLSAEKKVPQKALRLKTVSQDARSQWHSHKTSNYSESAHALRETKKAGYDDVLFVYRNTYLLECAFSNIFFIQKNVLVTPSLELPILNGVTRTKILEVARKMKIGVREKKIHQKTLSSFDGCFVTSSVRGIVRVRAIDHLCYAPKNLLLDTVEHEYKKLLSL
jgi:branched-subunit amino acid aminotransferase/4-amino-4-deoxychorismate lyase